MDPPQAQKKKRISDDESFTVIKRCCTIMSWVSRTSCTGAQFSVGFYHTACFEGLNRGISLSLSHRLFWLQNAPCLLPSGHLPAIHLHPCLKLQLFQALLTLSLPGFYWQGYFLFWEFSPSTSVTLKKASIWYHKTNRYGSPKPWAFRGLAGAPRGAASGQKHW